MDKILNAKQLLEKYEIRTFPVDVKEICKKENIFLIEEYDMETLEKKFDQGISGAFLRNALIDENGTEQNTIIVNEKDIPSRKRFTIAHELGHYFLHEDNKIISFRSERGLKETEANIFAAELLMPEHMLKAEYKKLEGENLPSCSVLADLFDVSKSAMSVRLMNLGLNFEEFSL